MAFEVRTANRAPMFELEVGETPEALTGPWVILGTTIFLHPAPPAPPTVSDERIQSP